MAGAGLDVFEHEPAINPKLLKLAAKGKVVLLPHMGSATIEGRIDMGEKVIINIRAHQDGHRAPTACCPTASHSALDQSLYSHVRGCVDARRARRQQMRPISAHSWRPADRRVDDLRAQAGPGFDVIALGARGGIEDGNLSAFMISPTGDGRAVTCDAGSLVNGLRVADEKGVFDGVAVPADSPYTRVGYVLTERIKGYLISHAHLDHVAGPGDRIARRREEADLRPASVLEKVQGTYFNWEAWPNFGTGGNEPRLKQCDDRPCPRRAARACRTAMQVTAYPLSHGGVELTAFLIESGEDALLCFGDTGRTRSRKSTSMHDIWMAVAERVKQKRLKAIIIETSYTNAQPDKSLFGHLTPAWLQKSLDGLETLAGAGSLKDLPVVISHVKYSLRKGELPTQTILGELEAGNTLGVKYVIPSRA